MLTSKILEPSHRCINCQLVLLRTFASSSGFQFLTPIRQHFTSRNRTFNRTFKSHRTFVSSQSRRSDLITQTAAQDSTHNEDDAGETDIVAAMGESYTATIATPWYLGVETPQRISNPLSERQRLPDIPSDSPPLLKPLLEHISIDLGLDDLAVFDLRNIDPPPALGANLLMVLGTARSEKHLHVSADRFCRWLKTTHRLSPYADGLLGKGELKLRLRRKARRARLLSKVGSSEAGNADDGIRTGWICVNVGTIEDGKNSVEDFAEQEGYVGFGSESGGAKVVVQMFTQEKRDELDLEDLWGKMLRRQDRKQSRISAGQEDLLLNQEVVQITI